jgi:metal-sulfur cluster biosynthetic enzyme
MITVERARIEEVRAALERVSDPELDESVLGLGFITGIEIMPDDAVSVAFRLPTYWCAANFSYLMASDIRDEVATIPWVTRVAVRLDDHMYVDAINDGVARNQDFAEAFPDQAQTDLTAIRRHFGLKSFERRQEALLHHLLARGHDPADILALDIEGLRRLPVSDAGEPLKHRYLERRGLAGNPPAAFVSRDGEPISVDALTPYLRNIRRIGLNAEFNGALCRGLLAVRYGEAPAQLPAEPALIDFIRMQGK